ncbi:MAG: DUF4157 domain-containing protein [Gemmatimonadetes bacterium]|nr:DUF4157 domain-containing protein [Gemmatimonadota bacterium]
MNGGECAACRARRHSGGAGEHARNAIGAPGRPLDRDTQARFGRWFGHDFSRVRVHTGGEAELAARRAGAIAWSTQGRIGFAEGAYRPGTSSGDRLLAHELAHVVQQTQAAGSSRTRNQSAEENGAAMAVRAWERGEPAPRQAAAPLTALRFAPPPGGAAPAPAPAPAPSPAPAGPVLALTPCAGQNKTDAEAAEKKLQAWLKKATSMLDAFVKAPADAAQAPVLNALTLHFHRADADLGAAVNDRLRKVQSATSGGTGGQCADATHPSCQAGADGFASVKDKAAGLCPLFFTEPIETQTNTLLHEGMHVHGAAHHIPDRAYSYHRHYAILTPEEAFDNADSFSNLVEDLVLGPGSSQAGAAAPPADTFRGCDSTQEGKISHALALTHKWLDPAFKAVNEPGLNSQAIVQTEVTRFLGDAKAATLQKATLAFARVGVVLEKSMSLVCEAAGKSCPAGTPGFFGPGKPGLHLCPEWFAIKTDDLRAQMIFDLLLQQHAKLHSVDSPSHVGLAKALFGISFAAPPAIPARPAPTPKPAPAGKP